MFFVAYLHDSSTAHSLPSIKDPDILIQCDLMDNRSNFLTFNRERLLEYSSLRRAKFSTMTLVYELHSEQVQSSLGQIHTCDRCHLNMFEGWDCFSCNQCKVRISCLSSCPNCLASLFTMLSETELDYGMSKKRIS